MTIHYSKNQEELALKNFYGKIYGKNNFLLNKFLILKKKFLIKLINLKNKIKKFIIKKNLSNKTDFHINDIDFDYLKKNFTANGYCFIENILKKEDYESIIKYWPHECFFYEPDSPLKNYKFGFRFLYNEFSNKYDFSKNEMMLELYNYLKSVKFEEYINKSIGENNYKVFSIVASLAKKNSYLIPHIDWVADDSMSNNIINVIYFIDGSNDTEYSGGTGIYNDNEFNKPVFIPRTLKNSAIIYNSKKKFFHGFKKIKMNNFRKAISFQLMKH